MLSVTDLCSYLYCPRKVYLQKVLKLKAPPKDVTTRGSIHHEVLDKINQTDKEVIISIKPNQDLNQIIQIYQTKYYGIIQETIKEFQDEIKKVNLDIEILSQELFPKCIILAKQKSEETYSYIQKYKVYGENLWNIIPKFLTELEISSEELGIRGIIDKVEILEDQKYLPYELKTGSMPINGVWPNHKIQILAYIMLLNSKFNTNITEGIVHYLDKDEKRLIKTNPFSEIKVKELIQEVNELILSKKIPEPVKNENKCRSCGLKEECYKQNNLKIAS